MQFRNMQGKPCSWLNSFESPEESIEIDRGVVVNRRWVFGAGAVAAVGLAFPFAPCVFAQEANPLIKDSTKLDENAITLEQFLSETRPAARTMVKSKVPDEEAFIELAMQQLGRLESIEASRAHPGGKGLDDGYVCIRATNHALSDSHGAKLGDQPARPSLSQRSFKRA